MRKLCGMCCRGLFTRVGGRLVRCVVSRGFFTSIVRCVVSRGSFTSIGAVM